MFVDKEPPKCPYKRLLWLRSSSVEEIEKEICMIPNFDPFFFPTTEYPGFLINDAIYKDHFALIKVLISNFPDLLGVTNGFMPPPLFSLLSKILFSCQKQKITSRIENFEWCVTTFPEYLNVRTSEKGNEEKKTVLHRLLLDLVMSHNFLITLPTFSGRNMIQLCKTMIIHGEMIIPSILPDFLLPEKEEWKVWASYSKEVLLLHFPKALVTLILGYAQEFWSALMPESRENSSLDESQLEYLKVLLKEVLQEIQIPAKTEIGKRKKTNSLGQRKKKKKMQ